MPESGVDVKHVPVLRDRCVQLLAPALGEPGAVFIDATLGMGGHTLAVLEAIPNVRVIAFDRDEQALALAKQRLAPHADRVSFVHAVYDDMAEACAELGVEEIHGVLFDLGVSSMQLDEAERGFSYAREAPLDMRMDQTSGLTAADVLNTYPARDLTRILREYGEEPFAPRIAKLIEAARAKKALATTTELADLVKQAIPAPARRTGGNPAKRSFQALRIEVNGELEALEEAIPQAANLLGIGGRIVVMSYQSLEDRIVKRTLAYGANSRAPIGLPVEPDGDKPFLTWLTNGAERASEAEITENPRSASVRLRAAQRVRPGCLPKVVKNHNGRVRATRQANSSGSDLRRNVTRQPHEGASR